MGFGALLSRLVTEVPVEGAAESDSDASRSVVYDGTAGARPDGRAAAAGLGGAALLVAGLSTRTLTESRSPRGGRPDIPGALTFGLALVSLVAALTLGRDGWLRAEVGLLFLATVVLMAVFVLIERLRLLHI